MAAELGRRYRQATAGSGLAGLRDLARETSALNQAGAVERDVRSLAEKMREIHGGEWLMLIDHQRRAVLVWEERE